MVKADVLASNGVVHIIDHVLLPPRSPGPGPGPANKTIVDIAVADRDLSTLVAALKAAGLVDTLSGAGPFTVLAPSNRAFERLPRGVLDHLLEPANKKELVEELTYHVAAGAVHAKDLHKYERIPTVEGGNVTVVETEVSAPILTQHPPARFPLTAMHCHHTARKEGILAERIPSRCAYGSDATPSGRSHT